MRKVILLLWAVWTGGLLYGQAELRIPDVNAELGAKVIVPVLAKEIENITALQFSVEFDPSTLAFDAESTFAGRLQTDHSVATAVRDGHLTVLVFSSSLAPFQAGEGSVLQLGFSSLGSRPPGDQTMLSLSDATAASPEAETRPLSLAGGAIHFNAQGNSPGLRDNLVVFPHLANGSFPGGNFRVTLILLNRTEAPVSGRADFFDSNGGALAVTLSDGRSGSSFEFSARPRAAAFLQTDGEGPLNSGYALISASAPLGGVLIFSAVGDGGGLLAEAGVGPSAPGIEFSLPVLYSRGAADTGLALANLTETPVTVTLILRDLAGSELERASLPLSAGQQAARFVSELFDFSGGQPDFQGSLDVQASGLVSVVALEQKGLALTTFPVQKKK